MLLSTDDELDFDVIVGTYGDAYDRYTVRLGEMRESLKIIEQALDGPSIGHYMETVARVHLDRIRSGEHWATAP